jgi:hypothetical protein
MSQRPMVSASRHFAHYYSDKVVERTKWSIFVPGAKGGQRWLVPHPIAPNQNYTFCISITGAVIVARRSVTL